MADFSLGEAALVGFRFARERPAAIAWWTGLQLVFNLAAAALMAGLGIDVAAAMQAAQAAEGQPDLTQVAPVMQAWAALLPLAMVFSALLMAAANRAVLAPQDDRFGYLRAGADEARMLIVMLALMGLMALAVFVASLLTAPLVAIGGASATPVVVPLTILALLWTWSRFSLAAPLTLARRRVSVGASWTLTRPVARKVFLTLTVSAGLYILVLLLGLTINVAIDGLLGMAGLAAPPTGPASIGDAFTPRALITELLASLISALGAAIIACPPAVIFEQLSRVQARPGD
ncbi:MAG: hypothetical protein ABW042_07635 [Phenylobacterium sp.]